MGYNYRERQQGGMGQLKKLNKDFFKDKTLDIARKLLGKVLVHDYEDKELMGRIVEVEAYIGAIDKAAHCYNNRRTKRTEVMFGPPGYAYVYFIYGMYNCLNVVTEERGKGAGILIRGLEPLKGLNDMSLNRYNKPLKDINQRQRINLTNGPGKLCRALNITKDNYGENLMGDKLFICDDGYKDFKLESSKRINIDYAEEAKDFMWRFFIKDNKYVSKK